MKGVLNVRHDDIRGFWNSDPNRVIEPHKWSRLVRCGQCEEVYQSEELLYCEVRGVWVCSASPECRGAHEDIQLVEEVDKPC